MARALESTAVKGLSLAGRLSLYFFFHKAGFAYLTVLFMAMFLKNFGAGGLPWYYVGQTTVFILTQLLVMRLTSWRGRQILSGLLPALGAAALFLTPAAGNIPGWLVFAAMMFFKAGEVHANQSFFDVSGQLLSVRESKQQLPGIMAAGTVGAVLAGFSLRFHHSEFTLAIFLAITAVIFSMARFLLPEGEEECPGNHNGAATASTGGLTECGGKTRFYVILVLIMSAAGTFTCSLIDFLFSGRVAVEWSDAAEIATFLGFFNAVTDLTILTSQGLFGGWIFKNLPLFAILTVRPLTLGLITLAAWWHPVFLLVLASQFLMRSTTLVFMSPAFVLLLEPLPVNARIHARRLLNILDAITTLSIGLGLILWTRSGGGTDSSLYLFDALLYGATLLLTRKLVSLYPEMIQETIAAAPVDARAAAIAGVRFLPEKQRISHIHGLLSAREPAIREMAIKECARHMTEETLDMLITFISREDHGPNLTLMVRAIMTGCGSEAGPLLAELLAEDQDPRIITDLLEAVGHADFPDLEKHSLRFLDFPHHRVRGAAMLNLLHHAHRRESLSRVIERLHNDIHSSDTLTRATMAVVMGRTGLKSFLPALFQLGNDSDEKVALKAIGALSSFALPQAGVFLEEKGKTGGKIGKAAKAAAVAVADAEFSSLSRLLHGLPDAERTRISFWRKSLGNRINQGLMQQLLDLDQPEKRELILRALSEVDSEIQEILQLCLQQTGQKTIIITTPLWEYLANSDWQKIPEAAQLIPALCDEEDPIGKRMLLKKTRLIGEAMTIIAANGERLSEFACVWHRRFEALLQILAWWSKNPAAWHDILQKARSSDRFINSVAEEFLETRLGKDFSNILLPLLNHNFKTDDLIKIFKLEILHEDSAAGDPEEALDRLESRFMRKENP